MSDNYTYEYLPLRGIEKETFAFYDVKTKIDGEGKPISLGFKYPNQAYKIRSLTDKSFWSTPGEAPKGLFGRDKFSSGSHKYVTITEGELDALSLYQVLGTPVVSVKSAASAQSDCISDLEWLNGYSRVYLAFDGDAAGREAVQRVSKLFDYDKVYVLKFTKRKDANEYLQNGEHQELKYLWWNAKKYLPDNIVSSLEEFKKILSEKPVMGVSYPFNTLTEMTYGIRKGETVLITAQEKVGKTEILHAIEHKLLKETDDGIGAFFLEEPASRHLQALAGLELQRPIHLPDCDCPRDETLAAIQKVVGREDRLHLYSHFGSSDPELLLDTIRFLVCARGCGFVFLDHLSMVVSGLESEDERRKLDFLSTRLEMMVKELEFALIMVSHVNDEGKTRGSRYPTKVADITINAERDMLSSDPVKRNTVRLTIPYNRYCGKTGHAGDILFVPEKYRFEELSSEAV